jgi:hypothetical protein
MKPMSTRNLLTLGVSLALTGIANFHAAAGELDKKVTIPPTPLDDGWRFSLSSPGLIPSLVGDIGIHGAITHVDLDPGVIIRHIDMVASLRAEAGKGRFGITADVLYLSLSDGVGPGTVVKKVDLQVDEFIGDLGLYWRLLEGKRGYLDVIGGVRYVNLYQKVALQPDAERITETSTALVDNVGNRLRTRLSESGLRDVIEQQFRTQLAALQGKQPTLPIGPIGDGARTPILDRIRQRIDARKVELAAALQARAQAATAALRARAQARLDDIKRDVSREIARSLEKGLDQTVSRTDDWWDPYIGLRGRFNLTDRLYFTAKGDVGGFGVGSDLTWQVEGALGFQVTKNISAEAGYRALGIDYDHGGLTYDTITHGAQVTLGLTF